MTRRDVRTVLSALRHPRVTTDAKGRWWRALTLEEAKAERAMERAVEKAKQ